MKTLIVGGGSIGERHLRCFQQTPPCEVALCEVREELRTQLTERYQLKQTFSSVEEAAAQAWDAVVICTPANFHVDHAVLLAQKSPAIMIEKPLSTKLEEIPRLVAATKGKLVNIAYVYRAHPSVQAVRKLLTAGEIGNLLQVTMVTGQHFPTFRPAYRQIYYTRHATGGGAVQDAITHMFDMTQYLAGRFDWVFCDYAHQALEGVDVEDTVHFVARTNGEKVMVSIALNQFMAPNETFVNLNGSLGTIEIRFHENRWGVLKNGQTEWVWNEIPLKERDDLFRRQARHFVEACAGREPVLCPIADALHILRVNVACLKSQGKERVMIEADNL